METALIWNRLRHKATGAAKIVPAIEEIAVPPRSLWRATLHEGECMTCKRGLVWLTQDGDTADYLLHAGGHFKTKRNARILVQALEDSLLYVEKGR